MGTSRLHLLVFSVLVGLQLVMVYWRQVPLEPGEVAGQLILASAAAFTFVVAVCAGVALIVRWQGGTWMYEMPLTHNFLAVLITFVAGGWVMPLFPGQARTRPRRHMRLGRYREELAYVDGAIQAMVVAGLGVVVGIAGRIAWERTDNLFAYHLMFVALFFGVFALMPFPKTFGLNVFMWSPPGWIVAQCAMLLAALVILPGYSSVPVLLGGGAAALFVAVLEVLPRLKFA